MSKESIIEQPGTIKKIKKVFLWSAVVILIGEFLFGAIVILFNDIWTPMLGRLQGTLLLAAVVLFAGVNNLNRIGHKDAMVRISAWISFATNILWFVLAALFIWEVVPFVEYKETSLGIFGGVRTKMYVMTALAKIMMVALSLGVSGFFISNVLAIKETVKQVKPLKIMAVICELYNCVFAIVIVLVGYEKITSDWEKWSALSGLAGLAFIVTALAALIISRSNGKKDGAQEKIDSEKMQATIQEMVEKEVQARMAAEKEKAERENTPPLQSDDMPPSVERDNEIKIDNPESDSSEEEN